METSIYAFNQMIDNKILLIIYVLYILSICFYNIAAINLTKLVSSTAGVVVDSIWSFFILVIFPYLS